MRKFRPTPSGAVEYVTWVFFEGRCLVTCRNFEHARGGQVLLEVSRQDHRCETIAAIERMRATPTDKAKIDEGNARRMLRLRLT